MDVSERRTVLKMAGSRIPGNAILIYFNIESESDEVSLVYIGLHHQLTNSEKIQPITTEQSHCRSILGFSQKVHSYIVLYCIVFIHFYSASHSLSLSEALPT